MQLSGTLAKVKESGAITLGVREAAGLSYTLGNGKYTGFHTEMGEIVLRDIQKSLGMPKLDIKYQPVTSQNRIPLVMNGTIDIECGSTTNNRTRQRDVAFAVTTFVEEQSIAVKLSSGITSIKELNGRTVAGTLGTMSLAQLRRHPRAVGVDFKELSGKDHSDSFGLLEMGRADAFVMDSSILARFISRSANPAGYKILADTFAHEPIACMLRKDDAAFKKMVDDSIKRQIADGSLWLLYDKWFMKPIPPSNERVGLPLSASTQSAWSSPNDKPMEDYTN
ncbi:amino acid ABC transporter substrate-binding protein [Diaphorobacter sp. HDW4B]|uniref:amino acid ABC transporter substrate-binding protein n=1 Tax=Diaphorobacter sp. HDW4B TaxID=2714925 RepID=UPI001F0E1D6D|nr:amino acid ABC transporter substrate-binding protein [Diaphorobacter sp. HDW4B]